MQWLAFPLVLLYLLRRILRNRAYLRHLGERFGSLKASWQRTAHGAIWLHAVSVGEAISAVPLVRELRSRYPNAPVYVSTSTLAGRAICLEKLDGMAAGIFYAPIDYRWFVRRVFRMLRPSLVCVLETEIWPNLYREAKRHGCSLVIVNGRISDRTFPTYRRWSWFFAPVLNQADLICVQSAQDYDRYLAVGVEPARLETLGNLKFDFNPSSKGIAPEVLEFLRGRERVWIAASTMPPVDGADVDEDDVVIAAFGDVRREHPGTLLLLVPRRPERFDLAAQKLAAAGLRFVRRTKIEEAMGDEDVLLLDSMGELGSLFAIATVVFMGGTIARRGGHNLLEPAFFAKPVIVGPHNHNFAEIHAEFSAAGALEQISLPAELAAAVNGLLADPGRRREIGERGRAIAESKRGVTAKAADRLLAACHAALPVSPRSLLATVLLWPFARIWAAFSRSSDGARKLDIPVISIGGITMGGAGKTPMVIWLSEKLRDRGWQPAILTRGYRRRTPHTTVIVPKGAKVDTGLTGDEAQIFVRRGVSHLGIGADRYVTAQRLLRRYPADVAILDDGFQHRKLARTVDVVLIDSLDPFGGGKVFPLGKLREPLEQLRRADLFVLTRVEPNQHTDGIERELRKYNEHAPVLRSRVRFRQWRGDGQPVGRVAAFCGLANPRTFWRTLEGLGIFARPKWEFGDHHVYTPKETARIAWQARNAKVDCVVTTEKDYMNLSDLALAEFRGLRLCWLEIDLEIEQEEQALATILERIAE
ncbi:hypothetical protein F183_A32300 [Bryobacterales bacterium F-183]|nr:hypothetical protein F183_A32300 [Bryobacterales bacterium F-183]